MEAGTCGIETEVDGREFPERRCSECGQPESVLDELGAERCEECNPHVLLWKSKQGPFRLQGYEQWVTIYHKGHAMEVGGEGLDVLIRVATEARDRLRAQSTGR